MESRKTKYKERPFKGEMVCFGRVGLHIRSMDLKMAILPNLGISP